MLKEVLRRSMRAPSFSLPTLLLVAAAVAVNASVFAVIYAMVWKPLPYQDSDQLVELRIDLRDVGMQVALSETLYRSVRDNTQVFAGAIGSIEATRSTVDETGRPWRMLRVTPDFLKVLGVAPARGRDFFSKDAGMGQTLLVSDRLWRTYLGGDNTVLGRNIRFKDQVFTVVGVMPADFTYPDAGVDAWVPYIPTVLEREQDAAGGFGQFQVLARMSEGVTHEQAQSALSSIFDHSKSLTRLRTSGGKPEADVRPWRERFSSGYLSALTLLQLAAALLLIVVTANLAYLVLVRLDARHREFTVCRALGAQRAHVLRLILMDVLPPTVAGLVLGVMLAPLGISLIGGLGLIPENLPNPVGADLAVPLAALTVATICLTVVMLSGLPALLRSLESAHGLRERSNASGIGRARAAMLVAQVALTTMMLGGGGLLLYSAINLASENLGFDPEHVVVTGIDLSEMQNRASLDGPAVAAVGARLRDVVASTPGVRVADFSNSPPFGDAQFVVKARTEDGRDLEVRSHEVSPGYFRTMGIRLLRSRLGHVAQSGSVVVDERFVTRTMRPGSDPIGAIVRILRDDGQGYREAQVVGVAPTIKHRSVDEDQQNGAVYDLSDTVGSNFFVVSRVSGEPGRQADIIARRVRGDAPEAVVTTSRPLRAAVDQTMAKRFAALKLIALFSAVTLALASLGLHAALSLNTRRRAGEIGVRMALGATARDIIRLVMVQGGRLVVAGIVLGLLLGVIGSRSLSDSLYGLQPYDPMTWALACVCVLVPALLACWLPARHATRIEPRAALMAE